MDLYLPIIVIISVVGAAIAGAVIGSTNNPISRWLD